MLVIDASAALYIAASEGSFESFGSMNEVAFFAPALLWSEATSVLKEMRWRGELSEPLGTITFERVMRAPIRRRASAPLYAAARDVARELGWAKTYDAEYVALARMLDAALVSRDGRLRGAPAASSRWSARTTSALGEAGRAHGGNTMRVNEDLAMSMVHRRQGAPDHRSTVRLRGPARSQPRMRRRTQAGSRT